MVALAGWWDSPTFTPIGELSAFYGKNHPVFQCARLGDMILKIRHWLMVFSA
jgi:hypothetical protein